MTNMAHSLYSTESFVSSQSSFFDNHDDALSASTASLNTVPPKALFFNPAIPLSYHKHHIRLYSDDNTFSTILKEDELCTVRDVLELLSRKYEMEDVIIILKDELTGHRRVLQNDDKIVKIQNRLFRSMWIDEDLLPTATLRFSHNFKFLIHKF
ncbi:CYFA0S01e10011g1_1 [Cyberlindnera fabianii]|uniref:CYFA0S01e10011g1_1 n=1 Tax=Cyberlindnera fabianii TaxID=36022 RepID=A0A061APS3_CYBFA|nr:CYFA0S01e10011g1_1 [Cyberlindnera fabianii]